MDTSINFYELKTQLADIGFNEPAIVDQLREAMYTEYNYASLYTEKDNTRFQINLEKDYTGTFSFDTYDAILTSGGQLRDQVFSPKVPVSEAIQLLQERLQRPDVTADIAGSSMNRQETRVSLGLSPNPTQREIDIATIVPQLKAIGLYSDRLEEQLAALPEKEIYRKEVLLEKEIDGQSLPISISVNLDEHQRLHFKGYELWPRITQIDFEHYQDNGVDTRELDARMASIDWQQHPGREISKKEIQNTAVLREMNQVFEDLKKLTTGYDGRNDEYQWLIKWATGGLSRKHFAGTPAEKFITGDNGDGRFIFRQRRAFPANVHLDIPLKQINNPDELNKMSYAYQHLAHKFQNPMNTQNVEFLKKALLNLGFGEQVNAELEKQIKAKTPEFTLAAKHEFNQQKVDHTLHFKAGENQEMYFFNKFDTTLDKGKEKEQNQTFYINKGNGITAKEAFNLMKGRAVYKQLFNKEGEGYHAWLQLDDKNLTQNGNKEIKRFNENYGFDLESVLKEKGIKELNTPEGTDNLFRSLKKGNAQQVTVERNGEEKKYFIAASPQYKTIDLYDHQMKKIKREELLQPEQKQTTGKKKSEQQKEDAPAKKQGNKRKMTV